MGEHLTWDELQHIQDQCDMHDVCLTDVQVLSMINEIRECRRIQTERDTENKRWSDESLKVIKAQLAARGEKWEDQHDRMA